MLIELQADKAVYFKDLLNNYPFIYKSQQVNDNFASLLCDLSDSIGYVKKSKKRLVQLKDAREFINEVVQSDVSI